jgi:S1-C subfamily serine protease
VIRGTLSNNVMFAIWRYTLGLQLLTAEYKAVAQSQDPADVLYRKELGLVAGRMMKNINDMQFVSGAKRVNLADLRVKIKGSKNKYSGPSHLGLICAFPSEEDYRGGALVSEVLPDTSAAAAKLRRGDRIIALNGLGIENSYDYYDIASRFLGGQQVEIKYYKAHQLGNGFKAPKKNKVKQTITVVIKNSWPGYLGAKVNSAHGGVNVLTLIHSEIRKSKKLKVGDLITEIDGVEINDIKDYRDQLDTLEMGKKIKVKIRRSENGKEKEKVIKSILIVPVPIGQVNVNPVYEDKSGRNGVKISAVAKQFKKNIKPGDRIIRFNNTPVLGLDHFVILLGTCPQDTPVDVRVIRDKKVVNVSVTPIESTFSVISDFHNFGEARAVGSSLEVVWNNDLSNEFSVKNNIIESVDREGVSSGLLEKNDQLISIEYNAKEYNFNEDLLRDVLANIPAGSEIIITLKRDKKKKIVTIKRTAKASAGGAARVQGGWSYYKMGEAYTFVTATVILAMLEAKEEMSRDLPKIYSKKIINDILQPAFDFMEKMNLHKVYAYRPGNIEKMDKKGRGALGRLPACELALFKGKIKNHNKRSLSNALNFWFKNRTELDKVRLYRFTHYEELYHNAAYYWLFSHYHAARAANELTGRSKNQVQNTVLKVMMATQRENGTWLGHYAFGELCGTARALMTFGEIKGKFRSKKEKKK